DLALLALGSLVVYAHRVVARAAAARDSTVGHDRHHAIRGLSGALVGSRADTPRDIAARARGLTQIVSGLAARLRGNAVRFRVYVQPRASRSEIVGTHGDALKVRLQAAPVDDAANEALIELLADALGLSRRAVRIAAGLRS